MNSQRWDRLAAVVFLCFLVVYLVLAWLASQLETQLLFGSIQGYRIFDIDDSYRRYLAATPFTLPGIWLWNFYLPFNLLFDGFFSWLSQHSAFWMRVPHLLANLGGLWLVYRAGRHMKVSPGWLLLACCTLMWMPLYVLTSMSFYGESLLMALMGVVIYALVTERLRLLCAMSALLPFIRPEGAFYLGGLVLKRLLTRRFKQALLMAAPALLYSIILMMAFHFSLSQYWLDRTAYGSIYTAIGVQSGFSNEAWLPYFTINPLWWLLGLAGGLLPSMKRLRPLFLGALVLMVYWFIQMKGGHANGEARYYLSLLPLFALSQAALLHALAQVLHKGWKRYGIMTGVLLMLCIGAENVLQLDAVRSQWTDGNRYPVGRTAGRVTSFVVLPNGYNRVLKEAYAFTCAYSKYDSSIDKVIVNSYQWFNRLDVCDLPDRVRVELSFQSPDVVYQYLQGYFFTLFPALPHYAFYHFFPAPNEKVSDGNRYALYVTLHDQMFPGDNITPLFTNQVFNVYKVRYTQYQHTPFFPLTESE